MESNVFFLLANLAILAATLWSTFRRNKFQNIVDDSTAAQNYRKMVIELQEESGKKDKKIEELEARIKDLENIVIGQVKIELTAQISHNPKITESRIELIKQAIKEPSQ